MELSTIFCGIKFPNPTVLASGIMGVTADSLAFVAKNGAGGLTTKSVNLAGRDGHPNPVIITYEGGMLNAVGLSNTGIEEKKTELTRLRKKVANPIILSIFAETIEEFKIIAAAADKTAADLIEVNISCPNVEDDLGKPFACCAAAPGKITAHVKANTGKPIIIKLSPNVNNLKEICREVEKAGADAISLINTVGPGMAINIETGKAVLANKVGGMSGPAIRPLAIKCVFEAYQAVKIPLIGIGGITTGRDAIEMMMAGAKLVGVGSAVYYRGITVFKKILAEMTAWMAQNNYTAWDQIIGLAHRG